MHCLARLTITLQLKTRGHCPLGPTPPIEQVKLPVPDREPEAANEPVTCEASCWEAPCKPSEQRPVMAGTGQRATSQTAAAQGEAASNGGLLRPGGGMVVDAGSST